MSRQDWTRYDCDLFIIGAGSGGVRAARIAGGHGARVMIAEDDRIGGTCVIRGCVPKKLYVYASRFGQAFEDAAGFGYPAIAPLTVDWDVLRDTVLGEVTRLSGLYRKGLDGANATIFEERATVAGPNAVTLAGGRTITAAHILIATGGRSSKEPAIPGGARGIVSDDIFHLARQPRRLLVIGGGYIGLEFASAFLGLGSEVTLVHRGDNVLRGFDEDLRTGVREALTARGLRFQFHRTVSRLDAAPDGAHRATLSDGTEIDADVVLVATGRTPNTAGLGLETAGIALDAFGAIPVDTASRSACPTIFAVGDVTNRVNLTPVAIREGHAVADTLFGARPWTVDYATIPTAVFTTPELGTVGLTEAQAGAQHPFVDVYEARFRPMLATISGRNERVLMKLLVDAATDRVLGLHIMGDGAAEIVQAAAIAVKMGATKADFDATMALHPSAAEELVTMRKMTRRIERAA